MDEPLAAAPEDAGDGETASFANTQARADITDAPVEPAEAPTDLTNAPAALDDAPADLSHTETDFPAVPMTFAAAPATLSAAPATDIAAVSLDITDETGALAGLIAPRVPVAEAYGGVGYRDISKPDGKVIVIVPPNLEYVPGDTVLLYWKDDKTAAQTYTIEPKDLFNPLTIPVDSLWVERQGDGLIPVWYTFTSSINNEVAASPKLMVVVKTTVPGGIDPDPVLTPETNERLAPPLVPSIVIGPSEAALGAIVHVPEWLNMHVGDKLRVRWGTQAVYHPPLTAEEVGKPVAVTVPERIILAAGDGEKIMVTYDIDDVVREWSYNSPAAFVNVEASGATLLKPGVLQASGDQLNFTGLQGAAADVIVTFQNPPMVVGDIVRVHFDGMSRGGFEVAYFVDIPVQSAGSFIFANIPNNVIGNVVPGIASVYYVVRSAAGQEKARSQRLSLTITGRAVILPAPSVMEADGATLDPAKVTNGATVIVPSWPGMALTDQVTMIWEGTRSSGLTLSHSETKIVGPNDVNQIMVFGVPKSAVDGLAGGNVRVSYFVTHGADRPRNSERLVLDVLGTIALERPDVGGVVNGELIPPNTPGAGVQVTVPMWELMAAGDKLEWFWTGVSPAGTTSGSVILDRTQVTRPYVFAVPRTVVDANANGRESVSVSYRVTRAGSEVAQNSAINQFRVTPPLAERLAAPSVDQASGGITLDPDSVPPQGATIRIPIYDGMISGDLVYVRFGSAVGPELIGTIDVTKNLVGHELTILVPKSKVQQYLGGPVVVNYSVLSPGGKLRDSANLVLNIATEVKWPAPRVDEADGDSLDPVVAAGGVTTRILRSTQMERNDRLVLHWGAPGDPGYYIDSITVSTQRDYRFLVEPEDVAPWIGKTVPVRYEVVRAGVTFRSETLNLRIGASATEPLPAPTIPEAPNGVIDPATIGTKVTARINVYPGMQLGDFITMTWGGGVGSGGLEWTIDVSSTVVGRPIERDIPLANITAFEGREVVLKYTVDSGTPPLRESEEYTVKIERASLTLPAPRVPAVSAGVLDPRQVPSGAQVLVDRHASMRLGDLIVLHWDSSKPGGSFTHSELVGSAQTPIPFTVPIANVLAGVDGTVEVWFQVMRGATEIATGEVLTFAIRQSALPLPVFTLANGQLLDPDRVPSTGATVTLAASGLFRANDQITLNWTGTVGAGTGSTTHTVSAAEAGGAITMTMPKSAVDANNGNTVTLAYSVTRAAGGAIERSGNNIYDIRRELGSGDLLVMGARYNSNSYRGSGASQYLRSISAVAPRGDLLAEWRYDDEVTWVTGVTFKDTRPWVPLKVRSKTNQITINPVNVVGSGSDSVSATGTAALVAILSPRNNVAVWGARAGGNDLSNNTAILTIDNVREVSSTSSAFALRYEQGQVATFGNTTYGGSIPQASRGITDAVRIHGNSGAFVAVRGGGYLTSWGFSQWGGTLANGADALTDVVKVASSGKAFCALRRAGQVVAWGDGASGGNPNQGITGLSNVRDVRGNYTSFIALLDNKSVIGWGDQTDGGLVPGAVASRRDIIELSSATARSFAVRTEGGQVLAWGRPGYGDVVPSPINGFIDIVQVVATWGAYCVLRSNGAVACWGDPNRGNSMPANIGLMRNIVHVCGTSGAFAALTRDGTVVVWGNPAHTNITAIAPLLVDIVALYSSTESFVAIKRNGGVVTWGVAAGGGDSSSVRAALENGVRYQASAGGVIVNAA
ncbi:hypothetical protein [Pandoraea anhela]|nr:hypothetical protein [Pandoraea anhela]